MKRDMELIKKILCEVERRCSVKDPRKITVDGYNPDVVEEHIRLSVEAGYIEAQGPWGSQGDNLFVSRLTWQGHDVLAEMRGES